MEIKNNLRSLVYEKGYRSLKKFSKDNELSYFSLLNLANNESKTLDKQLLIDLCVKLDCEIGDLLHFSQKK
jgi:DNA-binding Xre family transcriptional regulator